MLLNNSSSWLKFNEHTYQTSDRYAIQDLHKLNIIGRFVQWLVLVTFPDNLPPPFSTWRSEFHPKQSFHLGAQEENKGTTSNLRQKEEDTSEIREDWGRWGACNPWHCGERSTAGRLEKNKACREPSRQKSDLKTIHKQGSSDGNQMQNFALFWTTSPDYV